MNLHPDKLDLQYPSHTQAERQLQSLPRGQSGSPQTRESRFTRGSPTARSQHSASVGRNKPQHHCMAACSPVPLLSRVTPTPNAGNAVHHQRTGGLGSAPNPPVCFLDTQGESSPHLQLPHLQQELSCRRLRT